MEILSKCVYQQFPDLAALKVLIYLLAGVPGLAWVDNKIIMGKQSGEG